MRYQPAGRVSLVEIEGKLFRAADIIEVRCGLQTPALRRIPDLLRSNRCFAVVSRRGRRGRKAKQRKVFNIEAENYESYRLLVIGFKLIKAESLYLKPDAIVAS